MARVTALLARSAEEPARLLRPPSPKARDSSRTRTFAFDLRLRCTSRVADRMGLREVLVDLGQPAAICRFGASVQQLAGISVCGERDDWTGVVGVARCSFETDKIQDMEFPSWLGEQS